MQRRKKIKIKNGDGTAEAFKVQAPASIPNHRSSRSQGNNLRLRTQSPLPFPPFSSTNLNSFRTRNAPPPNSTTNKSRFSIFFSFRSIFIQLDFFFSVVAIYFVVLIWFVVFESEIRGRSGMRKSVAGRYRNCRKSWLQSKKSARNWRERFGEFDICKIVEFYFIFGT